MMETCEHFVDNVFFIPHVPTKFTGIHIMLAMYTNQAYSVEKQWKEA